MTSQQRAAASAADPGIQQPSRNVVASAGRVANLASPVTEAAGPWPDNEDGDGDDVQNDDEAGPTAGRASKRKREDSNGQGGQRRCGSDVASIRNSPLRTHVQSMMDTLQPYLLDMLDDTSNVNLWLTFLLPKFQDGNNFGVEVQESVLEHVSNASV